MPKKTPDVGNDVLCKRAKFKLGISYILSSAKIKKK
jgi:hypothetical protein